LNAESGQRSGGGRKKQSCGLASTAKSQLDPGRWCIFLIRPEQLLAADRNAVHPRLKSP